MFVAFEGADGSGKSTLAPLVAAMMGAAGVEFRTKSHVPEGPSFATAEMAALRKNLWPDSGIPDILEYPAQYWVLLQAAWYTLATRFTVEPTLQSGDTLVVDGWYYKFLAKAAMDSLDPLLLETAFAGVAVPDLVVHLNVDLGAVFDRDPSFTFHELGGYQPYAIRGRDSFIEHQTRIRRDIIERVPSDRLLDVELEADASPGHNAAIIYSAIAARLACAS